MYNMQSGMWRRKYELGTTPPEAASRKQPSDKGRVVNGMATDSLNKLVMASTSDGVINVSNIFCFKLRFTNSLQFFDFHTQALLHTLILPATCSSILLQRDSGLLAVTCDDRVVRLIDIETRRIVREMRGFKGDILDVVS